MAEQTVNTLPTVESLIKEIHDNLSQTSSSSKDEIRVMRSMLSDTSYIINKHNKDGSEEKYCPAEEFKSMCANIISGAARISKAEATQLVEDYVPSNSDARVMVGISTNFVNTYLDTGRKLPLGARDESDISLSRKRIDETIRSYPQKVGVNDDGSDRYSKAPTRIPAHDSVRVHAPCPPWVK